MFYMRPSRYTPSVTPTKRIIDNLAYVMHTMLSRSSHADTHGIGFLANMDDCKFTLYFNLSTWAVAPRLFHGSRPYACIGRYINSIASLTHVSINSLLIAGTMKNFDVDYCYQFMMTLQGYVVPVRVQLFLIVNPPSWFDVIWKIMKPMLVPSFRKKVKMIHQDELHKYLQEDYLKYLPDDGMKGIGQANTTELVEDFVSYRKYIDEVQHPSYEWDGGAGGGTNSAAAATANTKDDCKQREQPEFSTMFSKVLHDELQRTEATSNHHHQHHHQQQEPPLPPFSKTHVVTTNNKAKIATVGITTQAVRRTTRPLSWSRIR